MKNWGLWLRWSWRDLRARWLQVFAIALIIALGTGVFAGLGGQKTWRLDSLEESYRRLNVHDLKVQLADGSFIAQDDLENVLSGIEGVKALETRLVVPTLVDASTPDETIIVRGRLVGVDVSDNGPHVDSLYVGAGDGRALTAADAGTPAVVVEAKFADHYGLKPGDPVRISGDVTLDFVGAGYSPEYFMVMPDTMSFLGESVFAVLFLSMETVQQLTGREGLVNEVVVKIADLDDLDAISAEIERRMATSFPETGINMMPLVDDPIRKMLVTDAKGDQEIWNTIAFLFLLGAALGAFNLAGRIVESQRRQIGIGMALGLPRPWIAFRPLLVGLQIAILGTLFGLLAGLGFSRLFASVLKTTLPMPYWDVSLYLPGFMQATLLGILLPFIATLIPVWRAVRVAPIDAIQTGHLVAKGGGLTRLMHGIALPGKSFTQMPLRNLLCSPWRTLLTVLGIAVAIILMTVFVGFGDSFVATLDASNDAYLYQGSDRLLVNLDFFYPADNGEITALPSLTTTEGTPLFGAMDKSLIVGGRLLDGEDDINVSIELHDFSTAIWVPRLQAGRLDSAEPGLIISEKAAADLGVNVGDTVRVEFPRREGLLAFRLVESDLPVIGIHDNPLRPLAYMDISHADLMGLAGVTNLLVVTPADGVTGDLIKQTLLTQPGVASVQAITEYADAVDEAMDIFTTVLRIVQIVVLVMAFLIAFNTTSINVDERVREIATMFAFGLRLRTVTRMQMVENLIVGIWGTLIGIGLGWIVLNALLVARIEEQLADLKFTITISSTTLLISAVLGVLVVALTPLLSIRRMLRMDIPSTLRVME